MIINRDALLHAAPIKDMLATKEKYGGASYGMSEAGYDIRLKQGIEFDNRQGRNLVTIIQESLHETEIDTQAGNFVLGSAIEEFQMPTNLTGIVHDKSTWARRGLSVFNTVIEPGWHGFLTLELVYHGQGLLRLPIGVGIAQVVFHETVCHAQYDGKYQNQVNKPQEAIHD